MEQEFKKFVEQYNGCFFCLCPDGRVLVWTNEEESENDDGAKALDNFKTNGEEWVYECISRQNLEII